MKTKLLKKLKTEARRAYCIKKKAELPKIEPQLIAERKWDGVYIIGQRNFTDKGDVVEFRLKDAKKRLHILRNEYCVRRVAEMRESCRINRYNRL